MFEITEMYMCKFYFMLPSLICTYNPAGGPEDLEHSCVTRWYNLLYTRT